MAIKEYDRQVIKLISTQILKNQGRQVPKEFRPTSPQRV